MKKAKKVTLIIASSVIGSFCLLYFLGGYVAAICVADALFAKRQSAADPSPEGFSGSTFRTREDLPGLSSRIEVGFPSGDKQLQGYFYPCENPKGTFLFAHGLKGYADDQSALVQNYLLNQGYCVFSFDMRASGRSEGDGLSSLADGAYDVKAALDYLFTQNEFFTPMGELFLAGYSWGAYSVGAALNFDYPSPIKGVLSVSGFVDPEAEMIEMARNYVGSLADFTSLTLDWGLATKAGEDRRLSAANGILSSECKAFLIQGDNDSTVPLKASLYASLEESERVHKALRQGFTHVYPWLSENAFELTNDTLKPLYKELGEEGYRRYLLENPSLRDRANQIDEGLLKEALNFLKE